MKLQNINDEIKCALIYGAVLLIMMLIMLGGVEVYWIFKNW